MQFFGADAGADVLTGDKQSLTRDTSGLPHSGDLLGIFDLYHTGWILESASETRRVVSATSSCPSTVIRRPFLA